LIAVFADFAEIWKQAMFVAAVFQTMPATPHSHLHSSSKYSKLDCICHYDFFVAGPWHLWLILVLSPIFSEPSGHHQLYLLQETVWFLLPVTRVSCPATLL
jgi:hypothetical protein